jgi:type I restriction enzyme S subunit
MSFPRYRGYKWSGIDWLGEVPEHWYIRALKSIVSTPITDGPHETPKFVNDGIPFVSAEAVSSGQLDFDKIRGFISESDHRCYSAKYRPQLDDIFMIKSGATTGVTAIVETYADFNIWSPLAAIRCGSECVPRFLLNFMRSRNFREAIALNWSFGTQQNIGMGVIQNLPVALPPVEEQAAIASFLSRETSKIGSLVAEQRRLMTLLKEKRQAIISHAVTKGLNPAAPMKDSGIEWLRDVPEHWATVPLGRLCSQVSDGPHFSPPYCEDGVLFLSARNIRVDGWSLDDAKFISEADYTEFCKRVIPVKGDILYTKGGTTGSPGSSIWKKGSRSGSTSQS